jgi:DNA polymerase III delta prime subunit
MSARVLEDILRSLEFPSDSSTGLRIIILDEFQRALNDRIQDQFLIALEKYTNILLIFCLIDLKKVHEAFQQRPTVLKTKRPEIEELIPWLQKICTAEKIVVKDNSALEQVARSAHRLPRECLAFLEKAVWLGEPLSTALVKEIAQDHEDSKYSLDD